MNRKRYMILIALIIFIFLALFTFANPNNEEVGEDSDNRVLEEIEEDDVNNLVEETEKEDVNKDIATNTVQNIINIEDNSYELALNAVVKAEISLEEEKYNIALALTNNVKDDAKKTELEARLEKVLDTMELIDLVKELIEKTITSKNRRELDVARNYEEANEIISRVSELFNEVLKDSLNDDIETILPLLEDKTKPTINIEDEAILSKTVKIEATDDNGVVIELTKEGEDSKTVENGYEVTDGKYTLVVTDKAFNERVITFIVDTTAPTGTIEYSTVDPTNKAVIATLKVDEDVTVTNNDGSFEYKFEDNGSFEFEFVDVAGHKGTAKATVNNMDFTNPVISLESCTAGTCVRGMDNLDIKFYVYIDGELKHTVDSKTSPGGKYFSLDWLGDGNYKVEAIDYAGNESNVIELVIDNTPAEIVLPGTAGLNKNEYIVESGTEVTLEDVIAKAVDNIDGTKEIEPYRADLLISNIASENDYDYDFTNGFNTNYHGRYNLYYKYTDAAGNESEAVMLLVMKDTVAPTLKVTEKFERFEVKATDVTDVYYIIYKDGVKVWEIDCKTSPGGNMFSMSSGWFGYGEYTVEAYDKGGNKTTIIRTIEKTTKVTDEASLKNALANGGNIYIEGTIEVDENLVVSKDTTIIGGKILRSDNYTGTLLTVNDGITLNLKDLNVDSNNNWSFDYSSYNRYLNSLTATPTNDAHMFTTSEAGKPLATKSMIVVKGTLNLSGVTIKNHMGKSNAGVISDASSASKITMENTIIEHCSTAHDATVVSLEKGGVWIINDGTIIRGNHAGRNGGVVRADGSTAKIIMNGGIISDNTAVNTNGSVIMVYKSTFEMNGGQITNNSSLIGPNNGRNAAIYGHTQSHIIINGGLISGNKGAARGGIDAPYTGEEGNAATVVINGGSVINNISINNNRTKDILGGERFVINGGIFTQDVTELVAPNKQLVDNGDGTYSVISK